MINTSASATACAKAILIGEHAALYGFPAIALALRDICLNLDLELSSKNGESGSWHVFEQNRQISIPDSTLVNLNKVLQKALDFFIDTSNFLSLENIKVTINTQIPLGGGLGSSAALSVALVKALGNLFNKEIDIEKIIFLANSLDSIFHGTASGLDVSTIASEQAIKFTRKQMPVPVEIFSPFWIGLVDSEERSKTEIMINSVAQRRLREPLLVDEICHQIGAHAKAVIESLKMGDFSALGSSLNNSHECLKSIGVSTSKIDFMVSELLACGAQGAKVTGGGGGGMVLGVFLENPTQLLKSKFGTSNILVSYIDRVKVVSQT